MPLTVGAAQRQQGPAGPEGLDGELAAALARVHRLLGRLEREPGREQDITELIAVEGHLADVATALKAREAGQFCREQFAELGRRMGRTQVPAPRHRTRAAGQHPLKVVRD